eukprot:2088-Heterococcus_DN1.PRE.1
MLQCAAAGTCYKVLTQYCVSLSVCTTTDTELWLSAATAAFPTAAVALLHTALQQQQQQQQSTSEQRHTLLRLRCESVNRSNGVICRGDLVCALLAEASPDFSSVQSAQHSSVAKLLSAHAAATVLDDSDSSSSGSSSAVAYLRAALNDTAK